MSKIKDSGNRTKFPTGSVRDIKDGVGRCDLLPLDVVAGFMSDDKTVHILGSINHFMCTGDTGHLFEAILCFADYVELSISQLLLEVSKHYKQGAEKYGEYNWQKGIPIHSYIDSGVRHFLKYIDDQMDERHDRAFVWNMLGAIWTMEHKLEMIDIPFELLGGKLNESE